MCRSSRYITIITYAGQYTDISQRFSNEVRVCSILHRRDVNAVPFVGVYSTETHPFALVYEYMDGLDLEQYLRSESNAKRLELVLVPLYIRSTLGISTLIMATGDRYWSKLAPHARPWGCPREPPGGEPPISYIHLAQLI